jgi:hypothetical protein
MFVVMNIIKNNIYILTIQPKTVRGKSFIVRFIGVNVFLRGLLLTSITISSIELRK